MEDGLIVKDDRQTAVQGMTRKSWRVTEGPFHGLERAHLALQEGHIEGRSNWREIERSRFLGLREKRKPVPWRWL